MAARYIIETDSKQVFCGWNQLGQIVMKDDRALAYRMTGTVANRTLSKIQNFTGRQCKIATI